MPTSAVKYVLKDMGPQVPLIDQVTGNVMIVVDGSPVDIPKDLFSVLFKEYKEEEILSNPEGLDVFFDANKQFGMLTDQVRSMKSVGMTEDILKKIVLESLPKDPGIQEFASQLIEKAYKESK